HFVIECTKDGCWVRDLSSRHGTLVNGDRVTRRALTHGDVITAGESTFLVRLEQGAPAAPPKPTEAPAAAPPPTPAVAPPAGEAATAAPPLEFDPQFLSEFAARFNAG